MHAELCHPVLYLDAPGAERAQHRSRDPVDLRHPVTRRMPRHAEPARQFGAQVRLIQKPGGALMPIQQAGVERAPSAVDTAGHVRDQHVRVDLRITGPRRAMTERCGDQTGGVDLVHAVAAAASERRGAFEIPDRGHDRRVVRRDRLGRDATVSQRVQKRHRLGRRERRVKSWYASVRLRKDLVIAWICAGQHGVQRFVRDAAAER
jgi:hypothetical protein